MTNQIRRAALRWLIGLTLFAVAAIAAPNTTTQQDPTFRIMNLERRVDQLQQRVDTLDRAQLNQTFNSGQTTNYNQELLNEIQRQQLSLAQQNLELQRRVLELQKTVDRLVEQSQKTEKAPAPVKPEESAKPKATPRKP